MCRKSVGLIGTITLVGIFGCESVNSRHILGEKIQDDLAEQLDGTWVHGDAALTFHQTAPGEMRAAGVEWDDEEKKFKMLEFQLILSRLDDSIFLNLVRPVDLELPPEEKVEGMWYQFMRCELGEDEMTVWGVSTDPFAKAVEAKTLTGRVDTKLDDQGEIQERHVWIEGDKAALDRFVRDAGIEKLFAGEPTTLRRLTDDE